MLEQMSFKIIFSFCLQSSENQEQPVQTHTTISKGMGKVHFGREHR